MLVLYFHFKLVQIKHYYFVKNFNLRNKQAELTIDYYLLYYNLRIKYQFIYFLGAIIIIINSCLHFMLHSILKKYQLISSLIIKILLLKLYYFIKFINVK